MNEQMNSPKHLLCFCSHSLLGEAGPESSWRLGHRKYQGAEPYCSGLLGPGDWQEVDTTWKQDKFQGKLLWETGLQSKRFWASEEPAPSPQGLDTSCISTSISAATRPHPFLSVRLPDSSLGRLEGGDRCHWDRQQLEWCLYHPSSVPSADPGSAAWYLMAQVLSKWR